MLFHIFENQAERRAFGGGDFVEFQVCRLKPGTSLEESLSGEWPDHWEDDSLYLCGDDWPEFTEIYGEILTGGTYGNLEQGPLDWCGINYFTPEQEQVILARLETEKPPEYGTLLDWFRRGGVHNGFYVLGI